ncbi:aminodeoxychorismate/anthranilate synthase component II [Aminipila butyrica]|uniref:Aminodeoxychorismate/anthranilate synthase component II n=1 Tax=Aminipila butyrica TaxID=433296 RepID=A0A858BUT4_9FIRM|nr:aminodeoxychorismate/anthranilate synthase component II [Aminipila butyrica]QIB69142.1 aminodeoxychorismate/anthranilate synthase component II [Aminipila butyrica]
MILLIDNYDSFSYNLYQLIGTLAPDIQVVRNDQLTVEQVAEMKPEAIVLSPGPGRPGDAGICVELVRKLGDHLPILGICLGHQAICEAYGATVSYAKELVHGKKSVVALDTDSLVFTGLKRNIKVARYHSLAALRESLPENLKVTARTFDGEVMAVEHRQHPVYGLQFHPESILTEDGEQMMKNFLKGGMRR